ncbi:hypothetical protein LPW36_01850 [Jinshanibacter sp. LJY008]|uniref:Wzy n=1 Tax=Limnobaculum eriocheiris TaxID=2897391 RepID=A0A9X1MU58_9GAMM|nr:hypothetical protein [Limnobaculum eriocheiris]MCD1124787.1 hypothetical protein [Limnobaculum eriocheiris]
MEYMINEIYRYKNKLWFFLFYLYFTPLITNAIYIYSSGHLIGDFRSVEYNGSLFDIFLYLLAFILVLLGFVVILIIFNNVKGFEDREGHFTSFCYYLIVICGVGAFIFGGMAIGENAQSGILGVIQSILVKINPYFLLLIISANRLSIKRFILCALFIAYISYCQKSLQGYFVIAISSFVYILINYNMSKFRLFLLFLMPFILSFLVKDLLLFIYDVRQSTRGGEGIAADDIFIFALGRISSLSSYIYIDMINFHSELISPFFSLGIILERLTGISLLPAITPSILFNDFLLGDSADYSIFMSLPGHLLVMFRSDFPIACINSGFILTIYILIFYLTPYERKEHRVVIFLLATYMVNLSADIWELSMLFQSIIILRVLYFFFLSIRRVKIKYL